MKNLNVKFMAMSCLSAILMLLLVCNAVYAGPASPDPVEVLQPDGIRIKIRIQGDEFQNWIESEETGHTMLKNPASGYWEYAEQAPDGSLRGNGIRVLPNGVNAPANKPKSLKPLRNRDLEQQRRMRLQESYKQRLTSTRGSAPAGVQAAAPVAGNRNMLIILINFSNHTLTTTPANWYSTIFSTTSGTLSVANYYKDNSFSTLTLSPAPHRQTGNPSGIISVTIAANHPNSGSRFNYASETNILNLALAQAANHITFAAYDTNGNGTLEQPELMIYFIYAGYEASGSNQTPRIWAHAWGGAGVTAGTGGKAVAAWALSGELNDARVQHPMGIIAHELGHAICGLPDLYDTSGNNSAMGNFSLMAGGSWGRDAGQNGGTTPTLLDAWSREFLGWTTPVVMSVTGAISLNHPLTSPSAAYKLIKPATSSSEYFLIENRQPTGWDLGLRGMANFGGGWAGGLLITHIDNTAGTADSNDINNYTANSNTPGHQGVLPVQADTSSCNMLNIGSTCRGAATTLFYSGNNANWSRQTSPNSNYYSGSATDFSLIGISAPHSTMTANSPMPPVMNMNIVR